MSLLQLYAAKRSVSFARWGFLLRMIRAGSTEFNSAASWSGVLW